MQADHKAEMQIERVADAIVALSQFYKNPEVVFLKALDHILIALGTPADLVVSSSRDPTVVFSTGADRHSQNCQFVPFGLKFSVAPFVDANEPSIASAASVFLTTLSERISRLQAPGRSDLVTDILYSGLVSVTQSSSQANAAQISVGVKSATAIKLTADLRRRIGDFLEADYRVSLAELGSTSFARLLMFQRYMGRNGPEVHVHLLPSRGQKTNASATKQIRELSAELSGTVTDLFRTGLTRWIELPEHSRTTLSKLFWPDENRLNVSKSAMFAQIHVNGVAWLAFGILFRSDDNSRVEWAQKFYSYIFPYFTTNIRVFAEEAYFDEIGERVGDLLAKDDFEHLSSALSSLACVFPYSQIVRIWKDRADKIDVKLDRSLFPGTSVKYVSLDLERIKESLERERAAAKARLTKQSLAAARTSALQARGWAHDVKNWTAPMISALEDADAELKELLSNAPNGVLALDTVKYVILNARCLNAASLGIQNILDKKLEATGAVSPSVYLQGLSREDVLLYVETAFQLLMTLHSKMSVLVPDEDKLALDWQPRWDVARFSDVFAKSFRPDVETIVAGRRYERIEEIFDNFMFNSKLNVIVAFLREAVQNMKIPRRLIVDNNARIIVAYELEQRADRVVLHMRQEHLQEQKWETDIAPGLEKSLSLYGPEGANLGDIEKAEINYSNEAVPGGYRVRYHLPISFFHGGG